MKADLIKKVRADLIKKKCCLTNDRKIAGHAKSEYVSSVINEKNVN